MAKKFLSKFLLIIITVCVLATTLCGCTAKGAADIIEQDRNDNTVLAEEIIVLGVPNLVQVPIYFENARVSVEFDKSVSFVFDCWDKTKSRSKIGVSRSPVVIKSKMTDGIIESAVNWCGRFGKDADPDYVISDYLRVTAKERGHIVGYAVIFIEMWNQGYGGGGMVLANSVFPKQNGKFQPVTKQYVNERMDAVIAAHKNFSSSDIVAVDRGTEGILAEVTSTDDGTPAVLFGAQFAGATVEFNCVNKYDRTVVETGGVDVENTIKNYIKYDCPEGTDFKVKTLFIQTDPEFTQKRFIKVLVKEGRHTVGYALVAITNAPEGLGVEICKNVSFPKVDGKYQPISCKYISDEMEKIISGDTD